MSREKQVKKFEFGIPWLSLLIAFVEYLIAGAKAGALVFVLSYVSLGWLSLLGFIPIAGPFLYIGAFNWLQGGLLSLDPSLQTNFLFSVIFTIGLALSIVFTIIGVLLVLLVLAVIGIAVKGT